jgi:signal transduction protein with GAF and PtsI domain
MAGDPMCVTILVGLGYRHLSMNGRSVARVKYLLPLPPAADQAAETATLHKGRHLMAHLGGHLGFEAATS